MSNEATLADHYVTAFARNVQLIGQQQDSRLVNTVDSDLDATAIDERGKQFTAEFYGVRSLNKIKDRFGNTPNNVQQRIRRVGYYDAYDDSEMVETIDKAKALIDPTNPITKSMALALNRNRDDIIIAALNGAAYEGENGTTKKTFPAAQKIAVNDWSYFKGKADGGTIPTGNAPLTPAKVRNAKVLLDQSEIEGRRIALYNSTQLGNMLTSQEISSRDYDSVQALMDGDIKHWMGFQWVSSERLPSASSVRSCFFFIGDVIQYKAQTLQKTRISERADKRYNWQAYLQILHGAIRGQDDGVVEVLCDES